jgi:hypothetical protein
MRKWKQKNITRKTQLILPSPSIQENSYNDYGPYDHYDCNQNKKNDKKYYF